MNKIMIQGRLTRDPELTTTQGGTEMCKYSVAVNEPKNKDGNQKVNFFNCVAFGKGGVFVNKYFKKGDGIIVIGRMDSNKNEKDNHYYWNLVAENHEFPISKKDGGEAAAPADTAPATDPESGMTVAAPDDLPF